MYCCLGAIERAEVVGRDDALELAHLGALHQVAQLGLAQQKLCRIALVPT